MKLTLRAKLAAIVVTAGASFAIVIASGFIASASVTERLDSIRREYVPKIALRPSLQAEFEHLSRGLQDAVAAQDSESLAATDATRAHFLERLDEARSAVDPARAAELREALVDYHTVAREVSQRLIDGETGEELLDAMTSMQDKQARVRELIETTTAFDEDALEDAFSGAIAAQATAKSVLLWTGVLCLALTTLLTWWVGRGVLSSVAELVAGFKRFGKGEFSEPIATNTEDELAEAAGAANAMAASLEALHEERDRTEWLKAGHAGLAQELRGELSLREVGARAIRFLARYLDAPIGALYASDDIGTLSLVAGYAQDGSTPGAATMFKPGEGLVGEAALRDSPTVLSDPPSDYLRVKSGLGEGAPRAIVLFPLQASSKSVGLLELALFKPWTEEASYFLLSVSETLAIALQVARGRAARNELLAATQAQAQRLITQEEELRATNEELQVQQEELRHANDTLVHQTHELEEKNAALETSRRVLEEKATELATVSVYKSQFLANMSHELRTPLNSMLLLSNLLSENQTGNLTGKQVEYCKTVHSAGTELLALINQVLDLAKIESGKQDVDLGPVVLRDLIGQLERVFEPLATQKGLRLVLDVASDLPESITTDRQRLVQVTNNLLSNAIKFTDKGEVALRVARPPEGHRFRRSDLRRETTILISVRDTGLGIAVENRDRIFEPFEQADPSTGRRHGGTGLGLAIAREIAALLGGEITLESTLGTGSTFTLYLPDAGPSAAVPEARPRIPPSSEPQQRTSIEPSGATLLIVEDDVNFANALADLARRQGLQCLIAPDGGTAIRLAKAYSPDGIVVDLGLPDIDGWTVIERLRDDEETSAIPIFVVSARDPSGRELSLGAIGYLTKPCSRPQLIAMIRSLSPNRQVRLLVVEDDNATGESLMRLLGRENLTARRVQTAEQALAAIGEESFDCMVLDLSLPGMSGLELLTTLEDRADRPAVIVYTARALDKAETQRLEAYAEAVVLKEGSSMERLLDEVRSFAKKSAEVQPLKPVEQTLPPTTKILEGKKILVVDDDMRTVYALSAMLRSRGAEVVVADSGQAALTTLAAQTVDGVLMDIMMPGMDGYATTRRIRENARFRDLPIIALTAKAMLGDEQKCIEAGATAYLPKPVDPKRLFSMLAAHVGRAA